MTGINLSYVWIFILSSFHDFLLVFFNKLLSDKDIVGAHQVSKQIKRQLDQRKI